MIPSTSQLEFVINRMYETSSPSVQRNLDSSGEACKRVKDMQPTWTVTERRIKKFIQKQLKKRSQSCKKKICGSKSNDVPYELSLYPYDDTSSEYISDVTAESSSPASGESSSFSRNNVGIQPLAYYTYDMFSPIQTTKTYQPPYDELLSSTRSMTFTKQQISYSITSDDNNPLPFQQVRKISWADEQHQKDENEDESTLVGLCFANDEVVQPDNATTSEGDLSKTMTTAISSNCSSDSAYLDDNNGAKDDICSFLCSIS